VKTGGGESTLLHTDAGAPALLLDIAQGWEGLPGERRMIAGVLRWLMGARWLGPASRAAFEVPWRGRRIDLATITGDGTLAAFEFKLGGTGRVFEQAIYNAGSAHRSYVVCGAVPGPRYCELARAEGIGIFVVNGSVRLLERPRLHRPEPEAVRSLRSIIRLRVSADV
jgi:hypothetical protein